MINDHDDSDEGDSDNEYDSDEFVDDGEVEISELEAWTTPPLSPAEQRAHHSMQTCRKTRKFTPKDMYEESFMNLIVDVLTQFHMNEGLKRFRGMGLKAIHKEMKQLHDKMVFIPEHARDLTRRQNKEALRSLMFLKKKRLGDIKGCTCAD